MPDRDLGGRVGLIGDVHGNVEFLIEAIYELDERGATSLVQLGDFGLVWDGRDAERNALSMLNDALEMTGHELLVVLGNHENYDLVERAPADGDGARRLGRVVILPRSGRMTAAGRPVGFLSGAASIDRSARTEGRSWWRQEQPTIEEASAFTERDGLLDVVLAHEAIRGSSLRLRLAASRSMWAPADLAYAERGADVFTERVLGVLADGGVALGGHLHFRHSSDEALIRPDGTSVRARTEVLAAEWVGESVGLLEVQSLTVESWNPDRPRLKRDWDDLRQLLKASPNSHAQVAESLGVSRRTLARMTGRHLPVPPGILRALVRLAEDTEPRGEDGAEDE